MTGLATLLSSNISAPGAKALKYSLMALTATALAACQTVDLGSPAESVKDAVAAPVCAVAASDYKVLAYLQKGGDDKKTMRITDVLKKKYGSAGTDAKSDPIMGAQAFVAGNADKSPNELAAMVADACK